MPTLGQIQIKIAAVLLAALLVVLIMAASWFYRDDIFQSIYDPGQPFQTYTPPPAPDYSQVESWLMRPEPGLDSIEFSGGDVFVVAPTIYLGGKDWNADLQSAKVQSGFSRLALPNYIMPYQAAGRVYAPAYRQAALYSFLTTREDAQAAQAFAYQDVERAFEVFLNENPPERPIVLVGHGQGGLHVQRLLADFFQGPGDKKLAAAYIIDHPLPLDRFERAFSQQHPCRDTHDTGCIVSFGAFTPNEDTRARMFVTKTLVWEGRHLKPVNGRPLLCTNPLLWTLSTDYAPARLHLGGVAAEGLDVGTQPAPSSQQTGVQCQDGILLIDKPRQKSLRRPSRFGGKFRTKPSNLFYEDLRIDAARRVQKLIDKNVLPRRAPLLELETIEVEESPVTLPLKKMKQ